MNKKSVAIITSTIGRKELERNILSIKAQTYPCKHYIFVDGAQFKDNAQAIIEKYDDLIVTYLPMNTGANGWVNSSINAIAPYLVQEDIICYIDDDNWIEPNHIETIIEKFTENPNADFVYSLRNLIDMDGSFICEDDFESLGFYQSKVCEPYILPVRLDGKDFHVVGQVKVPFHIDTNCYAFTQQTALSLAQIWFSGKNNDKHIFNYILQEKLVGVSTKQYTVNYTYDLLKQQDIKVAFERIGVILTDEIVRIIALEMIKGLRLENIRQYNGKRPWAESE